MANNVWSSLASTDGNVAANWSLLQVPTGTDVAYFDGTSVIGCTFSGAISCQGLVTVAAYTGAINLNGQTFTFTTSGMVLDNGTGSTFVCGAATIGITGGPFDNRHCTGWNANTATIVLNGACSVTGSSVYSLYDFTVASGTTTIDSGTLSYVPITHVCTISAALVLNDILYIATGGDLVINSGANITGGQYIHVYLATAGHGITTLQAGAVVGKIFVERPNAAAVFAPGTYTGWFWVYTNSTATSFTLTLSAGTYVFNGGLKLQNSGSSALRTLTLANNTNGPSITVGPPGLTIDLDSASHITINDSGQAVNWTITGNVVDERTGAGTFTWTKGTGTITFSDSADQNVDLMDQTVEDIVHNKSAGNFVLSGGFTTDSFTGTSTGTGDFDPNGQTINVAGACDWAAAFLFDSAADCMNACTWVITGAFTCNAQTLNATAAWYLQCHSTAVASGAGAVSYSDASGAGHTAITATTWTNSGNNLNWTFSTANRRRRFLIVGADT